MSDEFAGFVMRNVSVSGDARLGGKGGACRDDSPTAAPRPANPTDDDRVLSIGELSGSPSTGARS